MFLTALRDVDTFDRALAAGGDDFLTKPVRPAELVVRVRALLEARRMSAEIRQHYELIRKQRDDLMRLQLQKERLTALIVHDLKNPVHAMDLHAQVLQRNAGATRERARVRDADPRGRPFAHAADHEPARHQQERRGQARRTARSRSTSGSSHEKSMPHSSCARAQRA